MLPLAPAVVYDFIGRAFFVVVDARSGCGLVSNTDRDLGRRKKREPDANRDKNCDVGSCLGMDEWKIPAGNRYDTRTVGTVIV